MSDSDENEEEEELLLDSAAFTFRLPGESEIRANLLAQILSGFSESVYLLSKEHEEFEGCHLLVKAVEPGSLILPFEVVALAQQTILPFISQNAPTIIATIKGMLEIKKLLKGDKPKKVDSDVNEGSMLVVAPDGSSVSAPLGSRIVITNSRADKAISSICEAAKIHNPRGGFWFEQGEDQEYFSPDDVQDIALPQPFPEDRESKNTRTSRVTLLIKSLDLLGGSSWGFRYAGRTITAKIMDPAYLNSVHSGSKVYKAGDSLDVDLEISEVRSPSGEVTQEKYVITKVHSHQSQIGVD